MSAQRADGLELFFNRKVSQIQFNRRHLVPVKAESIPQLERAISRHPVEATSRRMDLILWRQADAAFGEPDLARSLIVQGHEQAPDFS